MRNPNGYGSVVKLSGNRRNPFCARKTVGFNEKGQPIYKSIGYYPSREIALMELGVYNSDPFDLDSSKMTMKQLFERLEKRSFPTPTDDDQTLSRKLGLSTARSLKSTFKQHTKLLHDKVYKDIKAYQMQEVIDNCGKGYSTQGTIKNLFWHLDRIALEMDIIKKANSDLIQVAQTPETTKKRFKEEEIKMLWENKNAPWVDTVLIFLYTGFRISELLDLKKEKVDLVDKVFSGGNKTAAGKNKVVPIHPLIFDIVKRFYESSEKYLIEWNGQRVNQGQYYLFWKVVMERFGMNYTPHECRHTFRSRLDDAGANKVCIDLMMGHKSKEVGERIYTHKDIDKLREAIELLDKGKSICNMVSKT